MLCPNEEYSWKERKNINDWSQPPAKGFEFHMNYLPLNVYMYGVINDWSQPPAKGFEFHMNYLPLNVYMYGVWAYNIRYFKWATARKSQSFIY